MPKVALTTLMTLAIVPTIIYIIDVVDVTKDKSLIYIDLHEGYYGLRV